MAIPPFNQGYPQNGQSLGASKATIRNNLDGTFQVFSFDHNNQNGTNAGTHDRSTYQSRTLRPKTTAGQITLYSKVVGGGTALFSIRDNTLATETQITPTTFEAPLVDKNGYTYLPGGIIYQWGFVNSTITDYTTENFNVPFANNVFCVFAQPYSTSKNPTGDAVVDIKKNASFPSLTQFKWAFVSGSDKWAGFYWFAIGN